mmetsp:Transcript_36325/g.82096  ORF Transcript_36325/g.82096 Transcript_36325/m.82096 type:complete len:499 (+) Transcript_36325:87-1583(+)
MAEENGIGEEVPAEEAPAEEAVKGEDEDGDSDEAEVPEHLRDAVEGNLRLKRMLSQDDEDGPPNKKRKSNNPPGFDLKVNQMLMKWGLMQDMLVKHVLKSLSFDDLKELAASNFTPDKFHQYKSPSELVAKYAAEMKERKMAGGSTADRITLLKHRFKLDIAKDKLLRELSHKALRHVLNEYDGSVPLEEMITEAESMELEENLTAGAIPDSLGLKTMARFNRLELIDPLADAAVFGDANLTFSLKLAKHRKALGHVGRVIATTFEEVETLKERYKEIEESIKTLEDHYAEVYHGVDCTRIAIDPRFEGMEGSLGAVYYNFPHSGAIQGFFDGHPIVNWRHENLMRLFFRALRSFVKPGGLVKVSSNMGATGVRYSYIVGSGIENEFIHEETMPFMDWHLHRYGRSYGDKRDVYKRPDATNNQSYNAQRAEADMVYCFRYAPSGDSIPKQMVRMPPSLKTLCACVEGPFRNLHEAGRKNLATQLHNRFVTEVSGTHVG